jgi:hypothetical protein
MKTLIEKLCGFHIQMEVFKVKWTIQLTKKLRAPQIRGIVAAIGSVSFVFQSRV